MQDFNNKESIGDEYFGGLCIFVLLSLDVQLLITFDFLSVKMC